MGWTDSREVIDSTLSNRAPGLSTSWFYEWNESTPPLESSKDVCESPDDSSFDFNYSLEALIRWRSRDLSRATHYSKYDLAVAEWSRTISRRTTIVAIYLSLKDSTLHHLIQALLAPIKKENSSKSKQDLKTLQINKPWPPTVLCVTASLFWSHSSSSGLRGMPPQIRWLQHPLEDKDSFTPTQEALFCCINGN